MSTVGTLYEETVKRGFGKLLVTQVATNAASIIFLAPFAAAEVDKYSSYVFMLEGVTPASDGAVFYVRMSTDNGATWGAASYGWQWSYYGSNATSPYWNSSNALGGVYLTYFQYSGGIFAGYGLSGEMSFANKSGPGVNNIGYCMTYLPSGSGLMYTFRGSGANMAYSVVNGVQFYMSPGLITGTIRLYGLRKGA